MNEFKLIDDREEPDEDSYETDPELIKRFEKQYNLKFLLDAAAKINNTKCQFFLGDALHQEWVLDDRQPERVDVWCNPPHSLNEEFIKRADAQHKKHNLRCCLIDGTSCSCQESGHETSRHFFLEVGIN